MTTKWPWTLTGQRYPIYTYNTHTHTQSPKIHSVSLYRQPFSSAGHVETSAPNDPKMTFNTKGSKVPPYICYQYIRVPTFTPFRSTASRFLVTGHSEKSTPNDPKWPWTLRGKRYPIYMLQLSPRQFLLYGHPRFKITGHFEKNASNGPKMTWNTKRS